MAEVLKTHRFEEGKLELDRLREIADALAGDKQNVDFHEAITTVLGYEDCYRLMLLGLERLLWLCRSPPAFSVVADNLNDNRVMNLVRSRLPRAVTRFRQAVESSKTDNFCHNLHNWTILGNS